MPDLERTLELAKRGKFTRAELYAGIQALAEQSREVGQSAAQAFAKLIATPEGSELFQIQKSLPGRDIDAAWSAPVMKGQPGAGDVHTPSSDWDGLVNGLMRSQKMSHNKAITAALSSEEGRHLFKQQKRAEQVASGQFSSDDMKMLDGIDEEQQEHADFHKRANQYKSEFEHMVDDVRRLRPHLTESQAQDHVRSGAAGMAAWLKHKGKPGQNGPHNMGFEESPPAATSGRTDPPRAGLWDSPHAGSRYTPPTGTPRSAGDIRPGPNDVPALKRWVDLKRKFMRETGWPEERVIDILKCMPEGRRAIAAVIKEAAEAAAQV